MAVYQFLDFIPVIHPTAFVHPQANVTGGRILHSAAIELQETGKKYALVSMCIGVGQGYATILERA